MQEVKTTLNGVSVTTAPTILIVEDHDAVRASLRDWLSATFPNLDCLEARTGEEAVALVPGRPPALVLMDVALPGMNGIEATRRIKLDAPQTQVVILSIHEDAHYQLDAATAGASAYVPKRRMHVELIPIITKLLPFVTLLVLLALSGHGLIGV